MILRQYQMEAASAIKKALSLGVTRQAVVLPTGSGKSLVFSNIPSIVNVLHGQQIWLAAHREELIAQNARHFQRANPDLKVGIEKAGQKCDLDADIVIASVQSIGTAGEGFTSRIQRFDPSRVRVVIPDELHHFTSKINLNILKYLKVLKGEPDEDKTKLLCGFTATPNRSDGIGLERIVDQIVYSKDMRELIDAGWLAPLAGFRVETSIDLTGVKVTRGDFAIGELGSKVNTEARNQQVVAKYIEIANGKSAIAFTVDVQHSHNLAMEFRRAGVTAMPISGQTPTEERERLLKSHASGETTVLLSCGVLSEGTDVPHCEVGLMARPTKSSLLFTQMVGRLSRPFPNPEAVLAGEPKIKQSAIIVDFVDLTAKHQVMTVPTLFGLHRNFDARGGSVTAALAEVEAKQEEFKQLKLDSFGNLVELQSIVQAIDLLRPPTVPQEITGITTLTWFAGPGGSYQIVGPLTHLSVRQNQLGQFEVAKHENGLRRLLRTHGTLAEAIGQAENMIPEQDLILLKSGSRWRSEPPTSKQIRLALDARSGDV